MTATINFSLCSEMALKIGRRNRFGLSRGVARIFKREGGHTGSNNIVMAFSPRNIVGCLLKKRLTKGGHGHLRTPLATPLLSS